MADSRPQPAPRAVRFVVPSLPGASTDAPSVLRCAVCTDPMPADLVDLEGWSTHPCCDPAGARDMHRWVELLRREQVRMRADRARQALHEAEARRAAS